MESVFVNYGGYLELIVDSDFLNFVDLKRVTNDMIKVEIDEECIEYIRNKKRDIEELISIMYTYNLYSLNLEGSVEIKRCLDPEKEEEMIKIVKVKV